MVNTTPTAFRTGLVLARWRRGMATLLVAGGLLPVASCCNDDSSSAASTTSITIQEERSYSFEDSEHGWTSPGPVAKVRLEVNDFHHGDMAITIHDALGRVIFSKIYWTFDWYWYIDGEFTDVDFTGPGEPGPWTILLEYSGFTGDVTLVVETTADVPVEPVVPPPVSQSDLLDGNYGDAGRAAFATDSAGGRRLVVDAGGGTIACGTSVDTNGQRSLSLWRFTTDGQLDTSFGSNGRFLLANPEISASAGFDLALDGAGGILAAGWVAGRTGGPTSRSSASPAPACSTRRSPRAGSRGSTRGPTKTAPVSLATAQAGSMWPGPRGPRTTQAGTCSWHACSATVRSTCRSAPGASFDPPWIRPTAVWTWRSRPASPSSWVRAGKGSC